MELFNSVLQHVEVPGLATVLLLVHRLHPTPPVTALSATTLTLVITTQERLQLDGTETTHAMVTVLESVTLRAATCL